MGEVGRDRAWHFGLLVAVLLAILAYVQVSSIRQESQTWDEAFELAGGYRYLKTGEYRLQIEYPPLGKILVALPLLLLDPSLPSEDPSWGAEREAKYGAAFLYRNRVPADTLLFAGRLVTILVTLSLGLVLALWTRRAFGPATALFALLLYCFDPNVIAQGRYTKAGLLLTSLVFLASITWAGYLERPRRGMLAATGIIFGLALSTKFSALFLLPVFMGLYLVRWRQSGGAFSVWKFVGAHAVIAMLGMTVLLAMYAPETKGLLPMTRSMRQAEGTAPSLRSRMEQSTLVGRTIAWTGARLGWRVHSLPVGVGYFAAYERHGHEAYLLGMHSQQGWWYYFPLAFFFKTPVATLLAIALAAGLSLRARLRHFPFPLWCMAVPLLAYLPLCLLTHINTGVRHLLPAYPFLFVLISAVLVTPKWRRRTPALGLLALLLIAESLSIYPHYTAFFNRLVGGPSSGPRYLVDSNLDWGQDLKKLKAYLDQHSIPKVCLSYFGAADWGYYGIVSEPLLDPRRAAPDCVLAVSATALQDMYLPKGTFAWLRQQKPSARVGYSIYVYDLRAKTGTGPIR